MTQTDFFRQCVEEGIHRDACVGQNYAVEMREAGYPKSHYNAVYDLPTWALQGGSYPGQHSASNVAQPAQGLPFWALGIALAVGIAAALRRK